LGNVPPALPLIAKLIQRLISRIDLYFFFTNILSILGMHHTPFSVFSLNSCVTKKEKKLALANKEDITDAHRDYNTAKHGFIMSWWLCWLRDFWCHCLHISLIISPLSFINALAAIYCLRLPHLLFLHYNNKVAAFEERVLSLCLCGLWPRFLRISLFTTPKCVFFANSMYLIQIRFFILLFYNPQICNVPRA